MVHLWTYFLDVENWAFFLGDEEDRDETCRLNIEKNLGASKTFGSHFVSCLRMYLSSLLISFISQISNLG